MPKINLDEDKTLSEPIEIVIEGETFTVDKITDKTFRKMTEIGTIAEQFAYLTKTKKAVVENLNLAKVSKAMRHIMQFVVGSATGMDFDQLIAFASTKKEDKQTEEKNV